jgi:hypothetical protein
VGALALLAAVIPAGCSGDNGSPAAADDGGAEAAPARQAPSDDGEPDAGDCRTACETAHPAAVALDRAIVACWQASCAEACLDPDAGAPDGGDGGDTGAAPPDAGACSRPVATGNPSCDGCTTASCCRAWDGCFGDAECTALEACYRACP